MATRGPSIPLLIVFASTIFTLGYIGALGVFLVAGLIQALLGISHVGKKLIGWLSPAVTKGVFVGLAVMLALEQLPVWITGQTGMSILDLPVFGNDQAFTIGALALVVLIVDQVIRHLAPQSRWQML